VASAAIAGRTQCTLSSASGPPNRIARGGGTAKWHLADGERRETGMKVCERLARHAGSNAAGIMQTALVVELAEEKRAEKRAGAFRQTSQ
jgi:hypothetical protein